MKGRGGQEGGEGRGRGEGEGRGGGEGERGGEGEEVSGEGEGERSLLTLYNRQTSQDPANVCNRM